MPASTNRNLFLQVSGDVSNLQTSMKAGRTAILALADTAGDVQKEVQQALANISVDPSALKQLENSYRATFDNIRRNAQAAISANDNGGSASALGIINASGAQQQAAAAASQATQLRIAADAAAAVAERQGEAGVAARVLAAALEVQAIDAATVANAMRGQATVLAEVAAEARLAGAAEDEVSGSHARMGASGLIAEHVIRSFSDSVAAGQSPLRAATMELGRVSEALTLFAQQSNATKGFVGRLAAFMGGPWGLAFSVATAVLVPLVAELFEAKEAADLAKTGASGLAEAQSALGGIFDLTSGAIKSQNELLRLNARLTADNLRAQALKNRTDSNDALGSAGYSTAGKVASGLNVIARVLGGGQAGADLLSVHPRDGYGDNQAVLSLVRRVREANDTSDVAARGKLIDGIIKDARGTNFKNSGTDLQKFETAVDQARTAPDQEHAADLIDKALDTNTLPSELRNYERPKKPRKPKVDHSAEQAANKDRAYQSELGQAQDKYAKAQLALSDTAENRYKLEVDELTAAKVQRDLEIDDQVKAKKINDAQAAKLKALNAETTDAEKAAALRKEQQAILDRQLATDQAELDSKLALLQLQYGLATSSEARQALALQILAGEEQRSRNAANRDIASNDPEVQARGKRELSDVDAQHAGRVEQAKQQNADPLAAYALQLHKNTDNMNDALKNVEVDGLKSLEDGLTGIISGTETVSQAFKKMADAIIADLVRIAIEKAVVSLLGFKDGSVGSGSGFATGFIPGYASGVISGPGTGTSDSIPGWMDGVGAIRVSNGESIITAKATKENAPWLRAMNRGLKLPSFAIGMVGGGGVAAIPTSYPALPQASELRAAGGGRPISFDLRGAVMTADLVQQMQAMAAQSGGTAYVESVKHTNQSIAGLSRRSL